MKAKDDEPMSDDLLHRELESEGFARIFAQEKLIEEATELIASTMQDCDVSKADLAERLGTSRSHITQLLRGSRNMTLRTLADIMHALNKEVMLVSADRDDEDMPPACAAGADASAPPGLRPVE